MQRDPPLSRALSLLSPSPTKRLSHETTGKDDLTPQKQAVIPGVAPLIDELGPGAHDRLLQFAKRMRCHRPIDCETTARHDAKCYACVIYRRGGLYGNPKIVARRAI